jgi:acylphosphatase
MDTPYEKLLENLGKAEVKFIVVGGIAVALNGFVRTTEDVDILVETSDENIKRLLHALSSFGQGNARELSLGDFEATEGAVRVIEDFPLDIFTVMRGKQYRDLISATSQVKINSTKIDFLDAPTLVQLKEGSQREKDQIDVAALKRIDRANDL